MSSVVQTVDWYASPLTFDEPGELMFAHSWPLTRPQVDPRNTPPVPGSGSLPNVLHGLPIGTGPAKSATAVRVIVVCGMPKRPPKKLSTVFETVTRRRVGVPSMAGVTVTVFA